MWLTAGMSMLPAAAQTIGSGSTVLVSSISTTATPAFQGGTLETDQAGTYANNFTLQGTTTTSLIDAFGKTSTFSGIFSDATSGVAGALTVGDSVGNGIVTFSSVNTYTGITTINAGATLSLSGTGSIATSGGVYNAGTFDISATSAGASITTLSGAGGVTLGAQNLTLSTASGTFSGVISGTGELIVTGGTEILSGTNTYSGGTVINGGVLQVGDGTSNGAIAGGVSNNGTLAFDRADAISFDNVISGSGGVTQEGTGTLTLTTANTYTGATVVSAGVLALTGSGSIANSARVTATGTLDVSAVGASIKSLSGTGAVQLGSQTLTLTAGADTFSGIIEGSGNVVLLSGTQTLTGANTYSGSTLISGGTLRLGQSEITNTITDNATLSFYSASAIAMNGTVTGTGAVTQTGGGVTTLTTAQNYTGATTITMGTLALSGNGSILSSSGVTDNATFDISAVTGDASIVSLAGTGAVQLGTQTLILTNASGTFSGNIAGSGQLILAGGKETISGTNSFTGVTTISGGTLYLSSVSGLSTSSGVVDNGTLDVSGVTSAGISDSTSIASLSGSGTVVLGSKTLVLTNAAGTFSGTISGAGSLTVNGGTETLTGANSYTGATVITGGILALSGAGSLAATSTVQASGIFDVSAASAGGTVALGSLSGSGTVVLGANNLNLGIASTVFTGTITGTGGLIVSGGTQILAGSNNYTGGTTITAGTLQIGSNTSTGSILGNVTDNGTLAFNRYDSSIFSGTISGTGAVAQLGTGTTILTATNSYTGGTQITAGTLQVGNGSTTGTITGNVADNGTLAFNRADATSFNGTISGTGGVTQAGAGTLTLTGTNTYSGATAINNSTTLVLASSGSIAASSVVDNGTFDVSATPAPQVASLAGNGLVTLGAQTLQLANATGTFSGVIAGSGGLTIAGGTQILTGINSYTGTTRVSGGTLAGTGTVSSVSVDNGGTLSPGVSGGGTLKVNGGLTMAAGSTYLVNLSSSASGPSTSVTGAASLGGTLSVASSDGTYLLGQKMAILTAAGGINGSFTVAPIQSTGAQFASTVSYDANDVYLQVNLAKLSSLLPAAATTNQARVVGGIDAAIAAGSTLPSAFQNLGNVSSATLASDADQLTGEIAADMRLAGAALFDPFVDAVFDHIADVQQDYRKGGIQRRNLWASGFAGSSIVSGDEDVTGAHKFKSHAAGFAGGADWAIAPNFTLGAALSAGTTNFHLSNDLGSGRVEGYQLGIYGMMQVNPMLYGSFAGGLALDDITTNRTLTVSGTDQLTGKANAVMAGGRFETGLKMGFMSPYFALRDQLISVPGYAETAATGSSVFALKYDARTTNTAGAELGFRQSADIPLDRTWSLRLSDAMAWAHDMSGAPSATPQFVDVASSGFAVSGAQASRDAALISLGILLRGRNGLGIDAHFNSRTSANSQSYTGMVGINYTW